jgi:hypothetical protein
MNCCCESKSSRGRKAEPEPETLAGNPSGEKNPEMNSISDLEQVHKTRFLVT